MKALVMLRMTAVVLVCTMVLGWYVEERSDAMHERSRQTSAALERMLHQNEALNNLLAISVLEENILHAASYGTVRTELEATFSEVERLTQGMRLAGEITSLKEGSGELRVTEQGALALMRADAWNDARQVLFDDDYVLSRKMYEINSETAVGVLTGELDRQARTLSWQRQGMLVLRVLAVLMLLWAGKRYSERLHAELDEQERLRRALQVANEGLEAKVQERTAQLEAANALLERLSSTDALTGLPNRRSLDEALACEWARARRNGTSLAVAIMDVDWFKRYNDHYGHPAGDACLQAVAQVLRQTLTRSGDVVARYGGEEFVFIAPATSESAALEPVRRVLAALQACNIPHAPSPLGRVSLSVGVAACIPGRTEAIPDAQRLLERADHALYQAKQCGRNCIVGVTCGLIQDDGVEKELKKEH